MAEKKKKEAAVGGTSDAAEGDAASAHRDASGFPVDELGEPIPGHPHYFSLVAWEPNGRMDFVLRNLLKGEST